MTQPSPPKYLGGTGKTMSIRRRFDVFVLIISDDRTIILMGIGSQLDMSHTLVFRLIAE